MGRVGERVPLGLRVTAELKAKLDEIAESSGRSQSQEVELRLERSFDKEQHAAEVSALTKAEIQDQFGGENDKKFYFRNLLELLEENMDKELHEQREIYTQVFNDWKGDTEQTDDVTMLSILK